MENTLKQTDESQLSTCKMEREPDGTLLFRYTQAPPHWQKHLYKMFAFGAGIVAILMFLVGMLAIFSGNFPLGGTFGGILLTGFSVFIFWFTFKWLPMKMLLDSGELRIVPDVGFKLSNGNLPFNDVQKYLNGYESLTDSHDIRAVTNSGTHTIAKCGTELGYRALITSLQREGVIATD